MQAARRDIKFHEIFGEFPVNISSCLWKKVEKLERACAEMARRQFHYGTMRILRQQRSGPDHTVATRRSPHSTMRDEPIVVIPTVIKSTVTNPSCQGSAL